VNVIISYYFLPFSYSYLTYWLLLVRGLVIIVLIGVTVIVGY